MNRKLPPDAFEFYFSLGPARSYQSVAKKYLVSKRAVAAMAHRERWQVRISEIEAKARERANERALEALEDMNIRHLKVLRFIQGKAIEALKTMTLESAMDAVRAFALALDKERLIRGEPSDRTAVSLEEVIKREYENWMIRDGDQGANHEEVRSGSPGHK